MEADVLDRNDDGIVVQVKIPFGRSMLDNEEAIQEAVNAVGRVATSESLARFDTDGSPIDVGGVRFTSKGQHTEEYHCPYGSFSVLRHVYQHSKGGKTFVPMEQDARLCLNATPRLAKVVSSKYAQGGAPFVCRDLLENHGRKISKGYVKYLSEFVGSIAEAKEEQWAYALPDFKRPVRSISFGLDGTCMLLRDDGWREAMTGTISFFDRDGGRMHTIYLGAAPEYGKETFCNRFTGEIEKVVAQYPDIARVGIADGAASNWAILEPYVDEVVLDFFHVSEYVGRAATALHPKNLEAREAWLEDRLHRLKHNQGAAKRLLDEMLEGMAGVKGAKRREELQKTITYFENNYKKMRYPQQVKENRPIGSGVTEAACKVLVKQRLCNSGMRWKNNSASLVLSIRALILTPKRWSEFWKRIDRYGIPAL